MNGGRRAGTIPREPRGIGRLVGMAPQDRTVSQLVADRAFLAAVLLHRHRTIPDDGKARPPGPHGASPDATRRMRGPIPIEANSLDDTITSNAEILGEVAANGGRADGSEGLGFDAPPARHEHGDQVAIDSLVAEEAEERQDRRRRRRDREELRLPTHPRKEQDPEQRKDQGHQRDEDGLHDLELSVRRVLIGPDEQEHARRECPDQNARPPTHRSIGVFTLAHTVPHSFLRGDLAESWCQRRCRSQIHAAVRGGGRDRRVHGFDGTRRSMTPDPRSHAAPRDRAPPPIGTFAAR